MTRAQAWSEARRRWGRAIVKTHTPKRERFPWIRYIVGPLKGPLAVGRCWEEAFKNWK